MYIFYFKDSPTELAFKYAVYKINKDPYILTNRKTDILSLYFLKREVFNTENARHAVPHITR